MMQTVDPITINISPPPLAEETKTVPKEAKPEGDGPKGGEPGGGEPKGDGPNGGGPKPPLPPVTQPPRTYRLRRHNNRLSILVIVGSVVLWIWYVSRLAICWGNYGYFEKHVGIGLCNSYLGTALLLPVSLYFLVRALVELTNLGSADGGEGMLRPFRSFWSGYRSLEGWDFTHIHLSAVGFTSLTGLLFWIVFFSFIRF